MYSWPLNMVRRLRARRRMNREVGVWYHSEYAPACLGRTGRVLEIHLDRSELMVGSLVHDGLLKPRDIRPVPLISFEDLSQVHTQEYLQKTTQADVLAPIFGLDISEVRVDELLRAQRRAVGGTVAAALEVIQGPLQVGFNLGGGFHHAEPDQGSGFCVYNDVAVAIAKVRAAGYKEKIAIIDLDYHEGNGNAVCFANDPEILKYSIHGSVWTRGKFTGYQSFLLPPGTGDSRYLRVLENTLPKTLQKHRPGLVFYIAGTDVLNGDRLGEFKLSPKGLIARDQLVLKAVHAIGAKMVITLGGGYTAQAWQCSSNLLRLLLTEEANANRMVEPELRRLFNQIAGSINPRGLQQDGAKSLNFSEMDLLGDLGRLSRGHKILGHYSEHGVEFALERFGILGKLRDRGFSDLRIQTDPSDQDRQIIRVFGKKLPETPDRQLLTELVVRRLCLLPSESWELSDSLTFLSVEWLKLEDPTAEFTVHRPRLPGQEHPGLGIAQHIQELLVQACRHLQLDGIYSRPARYHNAALVSRWFHFLDPVAEGRLLAMRHVLAGHRLWKAAQLVEQGAVKLGNGISIGWVPADQVLPVSDRLLSYFDSRSYSDTSVESCNQLLEAGLHLAESGVPRAGF